MGGPDEHVAYISLEHTLSLFGRRIPGTDLQVNAQQVGPGLVNLFWETSIGRGVICQSITPVSPQKQILIHRFFAEPHIPQLVMKVFIWGENENVNRDQYIWDNKTFVKQPVLLREDALLGKFRRWYSRFFSQNSFKVAKCESIEW